MGNQTYGYARVSTEQQNLDRQIDALTGYGVDRLYNEKMTGTRKDRPELRKMLESLTEGVQWWWNLSPDWEGVPRDLLELTELFEKKGVHLISLKERIDTSSSTGRLLFTLMSAIAQFERDVIADRTREGLNSARARGHLGGRPKVPEDTIRKAIGIYHTGQYSIKEIEQLTGVKKSTLYRYLEGEKAEYSRTP